MHLIKGFGRTDDVSPSGMSDCLSALKTNYLLSVDTTTDFTVPWKNGSSVPRRILQKQDMQSYFWF